MSCRPCLVIRKAKWEHLQNQAGQVKTDDEATQSAKKREYYDALDEQSRTWTKTWPDTVEGCLAKVEARKQREFERNKAFIKSYKEQQIEKLAGRGKVLADAKKELFRTTNYGQLLASAVLESKVIEERNAQIEMKKFVEQQEKEYDEYVSAKIAAMENNYYDYGKKDDEKVKQRILAQKEQAEHNKLVHQLKEQELAEAKKQEQLDELEDARLQKLNLEFEKHEMDHCKEKAVQDRRQYEADCEALRAEKLKRTQADDALVAVWAKYHDKVWCKEKKTWEKIIKERGESSENYKKAYAMMEKSLENNKKSYEAFVDKRIEELEESQRKAEEKEHKAKQFSDATYRKQLVEDYKTALEVKEIQKHCDKCYCEKQSLFTKPDDKLAKKTAAERDPYKPESFLAPYTKLSSDLNARINAPSPWSGASDQHKYFAEQAAAAIAECAHKHAVNRVVQDYKKTYNLDSTSFPIPE
ncbi:hypothetical protein NE865_08904 [Phthorimaea operculella]|nr:hypothetical protein NE865_08904 [Phthorimaea operculella]